MTHHPSLEKFESPLLKREWALVQNVHEMAVHDVGMII
jgi:hypothetical protein